jgi:CHAD domain-containing protein
VTFTGKRIDKLWRSIEATGAQLDTLEEEPRHRLRIEIKKLRYALDFMAEPYSSKKGKQRKFMTSLEALQEQLGHLNDLATARSLSATYSEAPKLEAIVPISTTISEEATYLLEAQSAFKRLQVAGAFWR